MDRHKKAWDVTALGELLIDFTPLGKSPMGMNIFEQNPGGAPANMVCALSNLGCTTQFIGKVGADMHGEFLINTLQDKGVGTNGMVVSQNEFTTLAFVALDEKGNRSFSFARKPGADTCLTFDEVDRSLLTGCRVFHFGAVSLSKDPARTTTIQAATYAKEQGAIISYDPNYRHLLWDEGQQQAKTIMQSVIPLVDIIKISDEETHLLTSHRDPKKAATELLERGVKVVVVTLGKAGALLASKDVMVQVTAPDAKVVDTTGAGDSFFGGFIYKLLQDGLPLDNLDEVKCKEYLTFANTVASICVGRRGAIPALPTLTEVNEWLNR